MPSTNPSVRSRRQRARAPRRALAFAAFACALARVPIASGAEAAGDEPATECAASRADALLHDADVPSAADSAASARPRRLVAVPDLHGDLAHARRSLQLAGVLALDDASDPDAWIAGADAHLVQTGDILDRGENSIDVMDLLARLSERAAAAGGEVTALLGNHELMTLQGDLSTSPERRSSGSAANLDANNLGGEEMGTGTASARTGPRDRCAGPNSSAATERRARDYAERTLLAPPATARARRSSPTRVSARGTSTRTAAVDSVNAAARARWPETTDDASFARTTLRRESPLWNRSSGMNEDEAAVCAELDVVLRAVGARRMVVGHTVQAKGCERGVGGGCISSTWASRKIRGQRRGVVVRDRREGKRDGSRALRREDGVLESGGRTMR